MVLPVGFPAHAVEEAAQQRLVGVHLVIEGLREGHDKIDRRNNGRDPNLIML